MAVVIGLIARLGEEGTVTTIVAGAADFLGAGADHRARARDHGRDEERVHDRHHPALDGERGLGQVAGRFAILAFIVNLPIAFLVPSSSGHAALVMPILAPLADFAGVSRAIVGDRLPVRVGVRQPRHADLRRDHGRPRPFEGRLRPVPEVRVAVPRRRLRRRAARSSASPRRPAEHGKESEHEHCHRHRPAGHTPRSGRSGR